LPTSCRDHEPRASLDLGCGAGHASFALARGGARRVVAYDLAAQMLDVVAAEARVRGHGQIETCTGAAEQLALADASFDVVVTRYSRPSLARRAPGHPRSDPAYEARRHIGCDRCSRAREPPLGHRPSDRLRCCATDLTCATTRESEWRAQFASAGFAVPLIIVGKLPMEFEGWVARIGTSNSRIEALKVTFDELP